MNTFLVVISLLLHGVTIIALITLSLRVSKTKELELKQQKVAREIEDLFTTYLIEIKEENERMMNILEKNGQNENSYEPNHEKKSSQKSPKVALNVSEDVNVNKNSEQQDAPVLKQQQVDHKPIKEYKPPMPDEVEFIQPSLEARVFSLYDQGLSTEEIARKLDCGRTEVELMLKFHPRKL